MFFVGKHLNFSDITQALLTRGSEGVSKNCENYRKSLAPLLTEVARSRHLHTPVYCQVTPVTTKLSSEVSQFLLIMAPHRLFKPKIEPGTVKKVNYKNTLRGVLNFAIYILIFSPRVYLKAPNVQSFVSRTVSAPLYSLSLPSGSSLNDVRSQSRFQLSLLCPQFTIRVLVFVFRIFTVCARYWLMETRPKGLHSCSDECRVKL